ncbi:MAG TPA: hypothetical protein VFQ80_19825, partial [Thermomicrobiales bacterium]|nr:hypothetical protein [Thermomicrobiales bacterium]
MDADRFDCLTRRLTLRSASRRLVVAAPVVALSAGLFAETAGAKQRCAKSKRCGKDCCGKSKCFPKKIDPNDGQI